MSLNEPRSISPWEIEEESIAHDVDLKHQLILEQYRQAGEDFRHEDKTVWQTFAIIIGLNGLLLSTLKNDYTILILSLAGAISVIGGYCIMGRSALYQRMRVHIAEKIQNESGIFALYSTMPPHDFLKKECPLEKPLNFIEKISGKLIMRYILIFLFLIWFFAFSYGLYHYGYLYLAAAKEIENFIIYLI